MNAIRCTSPSAGQSISNLYQIKSFKTSDSLFKFIATGSNCCQWKIREDMNLPSGYYKAQIDSRSIRYINVKTDKVYSFVR